MAAKRRRDRAEILMVLDDDDENDNDLEFLLSAFCLPTTEKRCRLNLKDIPDDECLTMFRFEKNDVEHLAQALMLPQFYRCHQRTVCTSMEALMILLNRLVYPNRWCDLSSIFGRTEPEMSMIFNEIVNDLYTRFSHLLQQINHAWLDPEMFAEAIHIKGAPLKNCWLFIDGTARPICGPTISLSLIAY